MDASFRASMDQAPPLIGHNVVTSDVALTEGGTFGTLPGGDLRAVVDRTTPVL